jgi:hypothetical protein
MSKKIRKPRKTSEDFCPSCMNTSCNPVNAPLFQRKLDRRKAAGVCLSCGHNPCRCKSKMGRKVGGIVTPQMLDDEQCP